MIQIVGQNRIMRPPTIMIRFFITNKYVKGLFLRRNLQNAFLDFVYCFCFCFINLSLNAVCILQRQLIILICQNRSKLRTVDSRYPFMSTGIFYILDSVPAEYKRPVCFGIFRILIENLIINIHCLVKFIILAEMIGSVI